MVAWLCLSASTSVRASFIRNAATSTRSSAFLHSLTSDKNYRPARWTTGLAVSTASVDAKEGYDVINKGRGLGNYEPASFESEIYSWWEKTDCFDPDSKQKPFEGQKEPYILPMPPPNVTGRLHMGHAIFVALQDVLARFHRMRGSPVLWLPGTDHAGIATQLQVEKLLIAEGTNREEVGREEFLKRVWAYKEEQGGHITRQLRSLGASADWSRERFTMDADLSNSVVEAFVRLHEKGLVYRGEYMVNWAPLLQTAVSDLEVDYSNEEGKLYYFKYMVDGSDGECSDDAVVLFCWALCGRTTPTNISAWNPQSFFLSPPLDQKLSVETLLFVCTPTTIVTNI